MKQILAISLLLGLSCTSSWAYKSTYSHINVQLEESVKLDTVYLDLKNDPDFKFQNNLRWYQDKKLELFGIKTNKNEIFIEPLFYQIESFIEGISIVSMDNFQGAINDKGEVIIPFAYEELQTSSEYKIAFLEGGKWGFFNTEGKKVISAQYDYVGSYSDGLALASKDQLFGYIDHKGRVVIPFQYDYASNFEDGQAQVELKFESFTIDKKGTKVSY